LPEDIVVVNLLLFINYPRQKFTFFVFFWFRFKQRLHVRNAVAENASDTNSGFTCLGIATTNRIGSIDAIGPKEPRKVKLIETLTLTSSTHLS
jgi:hypothetical protein